ncbi:helix-turn-helix transcriptional regulator [Microbacterium paraoxydans]|jgi:transcriptional regulator with XRE-family HTH domain|uniref:helix-turn-helix domain-containing protein n=1 Tax=Microbacterium paraoxydans TaxID=199592 RepID=UPI00343A001B
MADIVPFPRAPHPVRPPSSGPEPLWRDLLGDQLRRRRHDRGETLSETAEKAGVSPQYLSEVERGRKEPSSEMIAAIAGALDATLVELTSAVAEELRQAAPAAAAATASRGAFALAA